MALPTIALAAHWSTVLPDDWSVIQGPISSLEPPAVVLRADGEWIAPSSYCLDLQRYAAIAVVSASSPADGEADLHHILHRLMENLPDDGWRFVSANAPVLDQSTGTALLAAKMILTYSNTEQEAS